MKKKSLVLYFGSNKKYVKINLSVFLVLRINFDEDVLEDPFGVDVDGRPVVQNLRQKSLFVTTRSGSS